ncbi:MAG: hypothetical protein AAFR23_09130, partial [Pseudomonadota bacterium]
SGRIWACPIWGWCRHFGQNKPPTAGSNAAMGYVTGATLAVDGGLKHYNWIEMAHGGAGQD